MLRFIRLLGGALGVILGITLAGLSDTLSDPSTEGRVLLLAWALAWGVVNHVCEDAALLDEALDTARAIVQMAWRRVPSSGALVSQMRSCQTTGDDQALPGMGVFQTTFSVSLQVVGGLASGETLFPCGPRQCPQLPARETEFRNGFCVN